MTRGLYPGIWNETHSEVALPWLCSARTATRIVDPGARPAIRVVVVGAVTPATFRAARPAHRNTEYVFAPPTPCHDRSIVVADTTLIVIPVGVVAPAASVACAVAAALPALFQASSRQVCVDRGESPASVADVVAASELAISVTVPPVVSESR